MRRFEIPNGDTGEATKFAGKEREYENKRVMLTDAGKKVEILDYLKDKGLYVVMNLDELGISSPAYRISPDKLRKMEEEESEYVHTSGEVLVLFAKLIGENKLFEAGETRFEVLRKLEDEQGLYLWEIKIADDDGGTIEYTYIRKGDYKARGLPGGSAPETAIHVVYFDSDGGWIHGHPVAKFLNGQWKDII